MTFYQYININIDRIRAEIKIGLIPSAILRHWEIYSRYDLHRKMGASVTTAVEYTSDDMRVSIGMVYRIIQKMKTDI